MILLAILAAVALGAWSERRKVRSWTRPLVVGVFPVPATDDPELRALVAGLDSEQLSPVARFFAAEARRLDAPSLDPLVLELGPVVSKRPPSPPDSGSALDAISFSLSLRYWSWRVRRSVDAPEVDLAVFLVLHPAAPGTELEHSVGLERGLVAVVHGFAGEAAMGPNHVVIAHELLHLFGATDKYEPGSGQPLHPEGYAEPERDPLHPQRFAEIMGGRIPESPSRATMPKTLEECMIGLTTAGEIGWYDAR